MLFIVIVATLELFWSLILIVAVPDAGSVAKSEILVSVVAVTASVYVICSPEEVVIPTVVAITSVLTLTPI